MLIRRGALADAEPLCQRALTGWEKVLGPDHPYTLTGVVNLAALMRDRGDLSQAEQLGRRAMETYERVVGPQAPETLEAMSSLADVLERARRNEDARMLRLRRIGLLAAQSDISPLALRGLARDCFVLGDYAKAEEILNRLVRLSFETSSTHHHLVRLYLMTDRFDEAREHVLLAWAARSDAKDYVIARLLWYKLTLVLVDTGVKTGVANEITLFLGQLKTALQREGAFQEWTMQPILDHLKLIVQEQEAGSRNWDLLCALVAALSERQNLSALNQFPVWCEALPQPLD
jgi:tetratricopeptide (TPR) repeat protein